MGADLYVAVGPGSGQAAHYYTSSNGSRLAKLVCDRLEGFRRVPEAGYLLSHTPCPALVLRTPLAKPTVIADGLFEAMRQYFGPNRQAKQ